MNNWAQVTEVVFSLGAPKELLNCLYIDDWLCLFELTLKVPIMTAAEDLH